MNMLLRRCGVVVIGVAVFAFFYCFAVLTHTGQRLENRALDAATPAHGNPLLLSLVSVPGLTIATIALVAFALLQRRMDAALRAALTLILCNVATQILKYHVLARPDFGGRLLRNTFPSGHTTAYLSVALAIILVVPARWRALASVIGAIITTIVVIDLLGYGWHRLSDIVGAATLVLTVLTMVLLSVRVRTPTQARPVFADMVSRILFLGGAIALGFGGLFALTSLTVPQGPNMFLLISSQFFATATIIGVFWVINRVFEPAARAREPARQLAPRL
jgi:hypothetical protein